ncbi:MAG: hypothetical protein WCO52_05895 [bacterium]
MNEVNMEELVSAYLAVRTEREKLTMEFESADAVLKSDLLEIETLMLATCNSMNANSINTVHGTVIRKINERFICSDWDNFRKFVLEHDAVDLFEKRIHQGNFREFMADHAEDGLPPGVNVMREVGITVRKASK